MDSLTYTLSTWHDDRATLTATGPSPAAAIAAGLTGLLVASRAACDPAGETDASTALAIRAEGANLAELFAGLASALVDEFEHDEYDVRAVRFDGMVRTDRGLAGWGYALAVPGEGTRSPITVEDVAVTDEGGLVTLRVTVRTR